MKSVKWMMAVVLVILLLCGFSLYGQQADQSDEKKAEEKIIVDIDDIDLDIDLSGLDALSELEHLKDLDKHLKGLSKHLEGLDKHLKHLEGLEVLQNLKGLESLEALKALDNLKGLEEALEGLEALAALEALDALDVLDVLEDVQVCSEEEKSQHKNNETGRHKKGKK